MPKRRVFNSSLAWLAAARATKKLRNSGGVAHIADYARNDDRCQWRDYRQRLLEEREGSDG